MSILFKNRDGQTPLEESMRNGLIPSHINDMTELYEYEIENIAMGIEWTKKTNKNHRDYFVWIEVHKKMFAKVWEWAGVVRTRELANSDFLMPYDIRPALKQLQGDFLFWIENRTFTDKELIARVHERFLTIHPFNDGNGRWSRLLVNMICKREKMIIPNWGITIQDNKKRRKRYISAVRNARKSEDYSDLISIMYSENGENK